MELNEQKPMQVFSGTAWQADQIKDMLMDNEIEAFLGDEIWGTDAPMERAPGMMAGEVSVFVGSDDVEEARNAVERYYEESSSGEYQ
jgi:hypothetical protein